MSEITIKHLTKRFVVRDHTVTALNDISLSIEKGEIYGIIGMSGAGKSTLVRSINYLEKPTEGEVIVRGVNLSELSSRYLRKKRSEICCAAFGILYQYNPPINNTAAMMMIDFFINPSCHI